MMSKISFATRVIQEMIILIKRGENCDDIANYPAIKELAESNEYFPDLMRSLTDISDFRYITPQEKAQARSHLMTVLRRKKEIRRHRRNLSVAASITGVLMLTAIALYISETSQEKMISYNMPSENYSAPVVILSNGERIDLSESLTTDDGNCRIENHGDRLVYESSDKLSDLSLPPHNTILIPPRCRYSVILSDGTKVTLNANSEIEYPVIFNGDERRVKLKGEAYFEVAKASHPFIVATEGIEIEVFGTSFNVDSHNCNEVIAVLISGCIGLRTADTEQVFLSPNQMAIVNIRDNSYSVTDSVNVSHYTGWKSDFFNYDNVPLSLLLKDVEAWYGIEFRYSPKSIDAIYVSAHMDRNQDADRIMSILSTLLDIKFYRKEVGIYEVVVR